MNEHLYTIPSGVIALALLVSMGLTKEIGYRAGLRKGRVGEKEAKDHIHAIQNSILGILALLLGFTFSLALQRFDSRSEAVVEEANAIGNAWLRADFLRDPVRTKALTQLREYADVRVKAGVLSLVDEDEREALLGRARAIQDRLVALGHEAEASAPPDPRSVAFVDAMAELGQTFRSRQAGLERHVPEMVLLLLYATFLLSSAIVGYSAGVVGHRPSVVSYLMVALVVILVFIILDLDRPRRGFIEVSQKSLLEVRAAMGGAGGSSAP
jgi:hypothetical protein